MQVYVGIPDKSAKRARNNVGVVNKLASEVILLIMPLRIF